MTVVAATSTVDRRDAYLRDGFTMLRAVLAEPELTELRAEADRLLELTVGASLALGERSPRLDICRRGDLVSVRKVQPVNDISVRLAALSADPRLVEPLAALLGSAPVLIEEKLNYKQLVDVPLPCERPGDSFDWHHDWAYFRQQGYPEETLTVAVMLDDNTVERGPIRVVPGSHHRDWRLRPGNPLVDEPVDDTCAVDLVGTAGDVAVFTSRLVHMSADNRADTPRRVLLLSYHPATHSAEPDLRNRPLREAGAAHERRYAEWLAAGNAPLFRVTPAG